MSGGSSINFDSVCCVRRQSTRLDLASDLRPTNEAPDLGGINMGKKKVWKRFFCRCWLGGVLESMPANENMQPDTAVIEGSGAEEGIYEDMQPAVPDPGEAVIYEEMAPVRVPDRRQCIHFLLDQLGDRRGERFTGGELIDILDVVYTKPLANCCLDCEIIESHQNPRSDEESDSGRGSEEENGPMTPPPTPASTPASPEEQSEAEKIICVEELFPDVWNDPIDLAALARQVEGELNPECCYRCGMVELFQKKKQSLGDPRGLMQRQN
ncbi:uncharacterized protein LOC125431320 [Sphaerodactylus townsendi]|uniref:uncharacterized protein LOC125431320 n=1 Tax=Sphaerodactylus townsendi TaxID=933632 RepID=UPI002026BB02|nr:uncharacterized protein LOC125431320 [Sphaerodactylus townsendi]